MLFEIQIERQVWEVVQRTGGTGIEWTRESTRDAAVQPLAVRGYRGLQLLLLDILQRKIIKPKSIQWYVNYMKMQWRVGVTADKAPPSHTVLPLKKTRDIWRGGGHGGQEWGREIFQLLSEIEKKKSKTSGAQVCLFVCFFQENFAEAMFLKCTFYKVYQIFSYLKPNVNRSV